jgi:DNA transformation protein
MAGQQIREWQLMNGAQTIDQLKGLGPRSRELLAKAGIHTVEQLRQLGSVEAYVRARRANEGVSLNLLWALESALTGEPWQQVARRHRTSLLLAVEECEKQGASQK